MKIGLVGNMNNNNFALMRYLRDLGADAHLLLNANDGKGTLEHFSPAADTWALEKWSPYIHRTRISDSIACALDFPWSWAAVAPAVVRRALRGVEMLAVPVARSEIRRTYREYDTLIGSGVAPAILARANRRLDVFYPYSMGVEFVDEFGFAQRLAHARSLEKAILGRARRRQVAAIRDARSVACLDAGATDAALRRIGVNAHRLPIPMVYRETPPTSGPPNERLAGVEELARRSGLAILHHARLMWKNPGRFTVEQWREQSKNSHWLFMAMAKLVSRRPSVAPRLFVLEYGPDVAATRALVDELGLADHVTWLPKLPRREIMWILSRVSMGAGEFYEIPRLTWGGTGWETLAAGRPLLQGFDFGPGEFEQEHGFAPPPLLAVKSARDVEDHLLRAADQPTALEAIGRAGREWFDTHNGLEAARTWLALAQPADAGSGGSGV